MSLRIQRRNFLVAVCLGGFYYMFFYAGSSNEYSQQYNYQNQNSSILPESLEASDDFLGSDDLFGRTYSGAESLVAPLKALAYSELKEATTQGLIPSNDTNKIHYKITKFEMSPGYGSRPRFNVTNAKNESLRLSTDNYNDACVHQIMCSIHNSGSIMHFPHYAQEVFPCFDILDQFPNAERIIQYEWNSEVMPGADLTISPWIADLKKALETNTDTHILHVDPEHPAKQLDTSCSWNAIIDIKDYNKYYPIRSEKQDGAYVLQNLRYLSHHALQIIQRSVLKHAYEFGPSNNIPIRVLFLNRHSTRHWVHHKEASQLLTSVWQDYLKIKEVDELEGSLEEQAFLMHNSDIIVSPHGAQLTNLAFVRPCTAVIELFPRNYYIGFFQPFVVAAAGISFEGYAYDYDRARETYEGSQTLEDRFSARAGPLETSAESIVYKFPQILLEVLQCRELWSNDE